MSCWKRFTRKLWRLATISGHERRLLVRAALLVLVVSWGLRLLGFRRYWQILNRHARATSPANERRTDSAELVTGTSRMVEIASRNLIPRPNCLARSMGLWSLLRRRGVPVDLQIGVRKVADNLEAHSWVSLEGRILNDTGDVGSRFKAFPNVSEALASLFPTSRPLRLSEGKGHPGSRASLGERP